jgi:nitrate reductase gamma subunit
MSLGFCIFVDVLGMILWIGLIVLALDRCFNGMQSIRKTAFEIVMYVLVLILCVLTATNHIEEYEQKHFPNTTQVKSFPDEELILSEEKT